MQILQMSKLDKKTKIIARKHTIGTEISAFLTITLYFLNHTIS